MSKSKLKIFDNMPSLSKLDKDIKSIKLPARLLSKKKYEEIKLIEDNLYNLINNIEKYNKRFSDSGWIAYDSISTKFVEKVNDIFENQDISSAENEILSYYKSDEVKQVIQRLKYKSEEFMKRNELIEHALNDHINENYYASIPILLIISDGIVNDYTRRKGFFSNESSSDCWDCLVGSDNGLQKLKNMYFIPRKKTNSEVITMPYRNGILHGRDLNYDNVYVSSKCIVLLIAIGDWVENKKTEKDRKEKFETEAIPKPLAEVIKNYQKVQITKKKISDWKSNQIEIGKDVPSDGLMKNYDGFEYLEAFLKIFSYWKTRNYGDLSKSLISMFKYEKNEKIHPKLCKELFWNLELINYKILEIEDRAIALKRILVEVKWKKGSKVFEEILEFGLHYKNVESKLALPCDKDGEWEIIPWNINGLYKI